MTPGTSTDDHRLPLPCGGALVNLVVSDDERTELVGRAGGLPSVQLTPRAVCDLELLATGGFSPLRGGPLRPRPRQHATGSVRAARDQGDVCASAPGELRGFTGIDDPYEAPDHADLVLETVGTDPEDNARQLLRLLVARGFLRGDAVPDQADASSTLPVGAETGVGASRR